MSIIYLVGKILITPEGDRWEVTEELFGTHYWLNDLDEENDFDDCSGSIPKDTLHKRIANGEYTIVVNE